jgi:hypothetical protein
VSNFTFDGVVLKYGGKTIANVRGDSIREGTGSHVAANIRGEQIREGMGSHTLFNVRGDEIRSGTGSSRIARMNEVDADIRGPGHIVKAALWLFFCR